VLIMPINVLGHSKRVGMEVGDTKLFLGKIPYRGLLNNPVDSDELRDIRVKIQIGLNALIQNEKAIWLRTKKGRDILGEFHEASLKLRDAVEQLEGETSATLLDGVKVALVDVEAVAKKLNDETRRRSMVVT